MKITEKIDALTYISQFPSRGVMESLKNDEIYLFLTQPLFDKDGYRSNNTSLSGVAGSSDQFSYGANLSHQQQGSETTAGGNLT